jgi:hypothetical protein
MCVCEREKMGRENRMTGSIIWASGRGRNNKPESLMMKRAQIENFSFETWCIPHQTKT